MTMSVDTNRALWELAERYTETLKHCLADRLVSVMLYGSVARNEARPSSDVDLLIIAKELPLGRFARLALLEAADRQIQPELERLRRWGLDPRFSRLLKTPEEASCIVPLYLDLVEDAIALYDRDGFFAAILEQLRDSLRRLGAVRRRRGQVRYWDLKPDLVPGERFVL